MRSIAPDIARAWSTRCIRSAATTAAALATLVALVACGAGCSDGSEASGFGPGVSDAGPRDAAGGCRSIERSEACREQRGCLWLTLSCDAGRVVGGCFGESRAAGEELTCDSLRDTGRRGDSDRDVCGDESGEGCGGESDAGSDATDAGDRSDGAADARTGDADAEGRDAGESDASVICSSYAGPSGCRSDRRCEWWQGTCGDRVVREECVESGTTPDLDCSSVPASKCHESDRRGSCPTASCEWVEAGCGGGTSQTIKVDECLPERTCTNDADCPTDHGCASVWIDPCSGQSCAACGRSADRCLPNSLLTP